MYKKKFTGMLVRNLILMAIPQIIIMVALIFTVMNTRRQEKVIVHDMDSLDEIEEYYIEGKINVIFTVEGLKYAGFDSVLEGEKLGQYFYKYVNGKVYFFLLNNESAEKVREGRSSKLRFRIQRDKAVSEHIMNEYIESLNLQNVNMEGTSSIYLLDQLKYPGTWILALKIMHYALVTSLLVLLFYILIAASNPSVIRQARPLKRFGKVRGVITDIDREMRKKLLYRSDNIYVTEGYLIVEYISRIDVVKLDDVRFISKNEMSIRKGLFGKKKSRFQLTLSNVEKMYFEMFIDDEQTIDDVIYYIRGEEA
ncbi:hypothetical protein SAMN04487934_101515 [Eubacterium ruminantium]|nr:hypothetical protein SAMN04487934_101515 [Eubacterium ruminantium]